MAQASTDEAGKLTRTYLEGSSGVFVPTAAVSLTGDPGAAILFGQIIWWFTRAQHPTTRNRSGHTWLVKPHASWEAECGLKPHQARRSLAKLQALGLVEAHTWKHDGTPQTHVRVLWDALEDLLEIAHPDFPDAASGNDEEVESLDLSDAASPPISETEDTTDLTPAPADAVAWHQRPDIVSLCDHLAERIAENGSKRPKVNTGWLVAAKRMLDVDKRDPEKAHRLIDWCQDDEFEQTVILSMPKFRARYDSLRLKANRQAKNGKPKETIGQSKARRGMERLAELEQQRELSA